MSRMGETICFDTTPLIWGIRGESSRGDENQVEKAKNYIKYLISWKKQIMVPTPVLAEYFIGADSTELHEASLLNLGFKVASLDIKSSMLAAELMRRGKLREIHEDHGISRQCAKIDALIIAIAITRQASKIVTHNTAEFRAIAGGRIPIIDIPDVDDPSPEAGMPLFEK